MECRVDWSTPFPKFSPDFTPFSVQNWTCGWDDKDKVLLRGQTISRERNETSSLRLGTPAHGVYALGVPYFTPLKLPLCTPVIGVLPQSTFQKCPEFWSDALHGVPIQMPWSRPCNGYGGRASCVGGTLVWTAVKFTPECSLFLSRYTETETVLWMKMWWYFSIVL